MKTPETIELESGLLYEYSIRKDDLAAGQIFAIGFDVLDCGLIIEFSDVIANTNLAELKMYDDEEDFTGGSAGNTSNRDRNSSDSHANLFSIAEGVTFTAANNPFLVKIPVTSKANQEVISVQGASVRKWSLKKSSKTVLTIKNNEGSAVMVFGISITIRPETTSF